VERQRLAVVVVALGIGLFGTAIAARTELNPWWTNAAVAVFVLAASAMLLKKQLASLFEVSWRAIGGAVLLAAAMVTATHLFFAFATGLVPGLEETVAALYRDIGAQSPGRVASVFLIAIVVVAEEMLWRGVVVELCAPRLRRAPTGLVVVLLYTVPQLIGGNWVLIAAAVVAGSVFTIQRLITGGLLAPITTHVIWSACTFSLLPLS
jgi:membrane protease YdiL (CAAX protease family)